MSKIVTKLADLLSQEKALDTMVKFVKTTFPARSIKQNVIVKYSDLVDLYGKIDLGKLHNHDKKFLDIYGPVVKELGCYQPKAFLQKVFYYPMLPHSTTAFGASWGLSPANMDMELKEGQECELVPWGYAIFEPETNTTYILSKGTVPASTEVLNATGDEAAGYNYDIRVAAKTIWDDCPGEIKKSIVAWLTCKIVYKGLDGKMHPLTMSAVEQMRFFVQTGFEPNSNLLLVGHSAGSTTGNIFFTEFGRGKAKVKSALALFVGPFQVFTEPTADYINKTAPGEILNVVCKNDFISRAPTMLDSLKTAFIDVDEYYSKEQNLAAWKNYPYFMTGRAFGVDVKPFGMSPTGFHTVEMYKALCSGENYALIKAIQKTMSTFKTLDGSTLIAAQILSKEDLDIIKWELDEQTSWGFQR